MSAPMKIEDHGAEGLVILDRNGNFYAKTYSWVDARLIAAAPALLAELREALLILDKRDKEYGELKADRDRMRAAIRAAREGK